MGVGFLGYKSETLKNADGGKRGSDGEFELTADLTAISLGASFWIN